ncbi:MULTISPECIES: ankyrin repeat domain-containing protein [unclassified Mesorhizobium]|uniref:ankyrin repeat domain-containing protein n=1 Tax=unclassified Mesorhizobium TaxID=325217 RepID=UPI0011296F14|nr:MULTISPECIES: ankyrin repeat domain-containing protein [unclassified Mesorhizobium]TPL05208.1 ankyrin repeat domain-containing protein [Mesorhizobium sp. B2-4-16]TPL74582.1 ankyrin repeat domain-containing protein [Mesorhizobium sp. B2-4-3]
MNQLPNRPDLDLLKKQAKDLLAAYRRGEPNALARFRESLPSAAGKDDQAIAALGLRLHDAQSCLAREYGFASWRDLGSFVTAQRAYGADRAASIHNWAGLIYAGDISGSTDRASPAAAARMVEEHPGFIQGDAYLACAVGEEAVLREATKQDAGWLNRPGGPLDLPPLVAVTHSSLVRLPRFRDALHAAARLLLEAGADPNQAVGSRWPPASLENPSDEYRLSALYGAAGQNHDLEMTKLLLDAGADPNDGESLYHSLENPACTRLLLEAGARVMGSNALYRVLDLDSLEALNLLLAAPDADPNEPAGSPPTSDWGRPLLWAIRRRRSPAHIEALLGAGADPTARTPEGLSAYQVALRFGLPDVAALLRQAGDDAPLPDDERFIAACAAGDETTARAIKARRPDLPASLSDQQLRLLPELAAQGCGVAVKTMVRLGWPAARRGGDWDASALNHAVFRGDTDLTTFLLEHGADWKEKHGFGGDVRGTLGWASVNEPEPGGDWVGCAATLVAHGMPTGRPDPQGRRAVVAFDDDLMVFSDEVADFLLGRAE